MKGIKDGRTNSSHLTREQLADLEKQWEEVLAGKGKSYSWQEAKKKARKHKPL